MTIPFSTRDRILDSAERLFASHGFEGTSLREVTRLADVNIAAVNYHFGNKEALVNEVVRRRMDVMSQARLARLQAARELSEQSLEAVLAAFIEPALAQAQMQHGGVAFVRILARAYAEQNRGLREFLSQRYGHVLKEFAQALGDCLPQLQKDELYWRLDFVAGALTYAMADFGLIRRPAHLSEAEHLQDCARHLIQFAAAGLRA